MTPPGMSLFIWTALALTTLAAKLKPNPWELPRNLGIDYGDVIQMKRDSSLWIGVRKKNGIGIATIDRRPDTTYAKVIFTSISNLVDEKIFLARKVNPFAKSPHWTRDHAVALIIALANKILRVGWQCRPSHWMSYVLSGKPTGFLDQWCPLRRNLSKKDGITPAQISDKDFYLENGIWRGNRKVIVDQLSKVHTETKSPENQSTVR